MQKLKVIILNLKNANYFLYKNIILVIYMINITKKIYLRIFYNSV